LTPLPDDLGTPGSYMSLGRDTPVLSSDGEKLGGVEEVRADAAADVFDGLVVAPGVLGRDRRFVEAAQVDEIYERGVVLTLDAREALDLPRPGDAAGER